MAPIHTEQARPSTTPPTPTQPPMLPFTPPRTPLRPAGHRPHQDCMLNLIPRSTRRLHGAHEPIRPQGYDAPPVPPRCLSTHRLTGAHTRSATRPTTTSAGPTFSRSRSHSRSHTRTPRPYASCRDCHRTSLSYSSGCLARASPPYSPPSTQTSIQAAPPTSAQSASTPAASTPAANTIAASMPVAVQASSRASYRAVALISPSPRAACRRDWARSCLPPREICRDPSEPPMSVQSPTATRTCRSPPSIEAMQARRCCGTSRTYVCAIWRSSRLAAGVLARCRPSTKRSPSPQSMRPHRARSHPQSRLGPMPTVHSPSLRPTPPLAPLVFQTARTASVHTTSCSSRQDGHSRPRARA